MKTITHRTLAVVTLIISAGLFAPRVSTDVRSIVTLTVRTDGQGQQLEINQEEKDSSEIQPPDKVMDAAGVRAGMVICGVGSGNGR